MRGEKGQIVLLLILVMTVALAIGLSVIQRSLTDISTASKVEQSSRAYSAAEAGIEQVLNTGITGTISLPNNSQATVTDTGLKPAVNPPQQQDALEYSALAKEETAHVWLADPNAALPTCSSPSICYTRTTLDIFWGDPDASSQGDKAALELNLIYYNGSQYKSRKWYLDQSSVSRNPANNFDQVTTCGGSGYAPRGSTTVYQCKVTLGDFSVNSSTNASLPSGLMLIRARLLYNTAYQPFAIQGKDSCSTEGCYIPPQARTLTAVGTSGTTQRTVQLLQIDKVVPPYFDYAIFSAGAIDK